MRSTLIKATIISTLLVVVTALEAGLLFIAANTGFLADLAALELKDTKNAFLDRIVERLNEAAQRYRINRTDDNADVLRIAHFRCYPHLRELFRWPSKTS